jgi:crotonobetainyl-CoA:carnitine CoA-transferase CaiB-like acyl-CoA transferase
MLALDGIRVLDLSRQLPGPFCTWLLADLGADVIRVEDPAAITRARGAAGGSPPVAEQGYDPHRQVLNRNKRSLVLNLKIAAGREVFYRLVERADVVVEGFRPGVTRRLGIDYETLQARNPRLIYCSLSGWGQTGPYREVAGHDIDYLAVAGVLDLTGPAGGPPAIPGVQVADIGGGALMAAFGIMVALFHRERTGQGQYIDVSMLDGAFAWLGHIVGRFFTGEVWGRGRGLLTGGVPCYNVYPTADGKYVAVGALEPWFWANLCRRLGREDLIPKQFATGPEGEAVRAELAAIFRTRSRDEWAAELMGADTCVAPVKDLGEALADPQIQARQMVIEVEDPRYGRVRQVGFPVKFSATPGRVRHLGGPLGADTGAVLRELGYSAAEVEDLRRAGAIPPEGGF